MGPLASQMGRKRQDVALFCARDENESTVRPEGSLNLVLGL